MSRKPAISLERAKAIFYLAGYATDQDLAKAFGISTGTVRSIRLGYRYREMHDVDTLARLDAERNKRIIEAGDQRYALNDDTILAIYADRKKMKIKEAAEKYDVCHNTIWAIWSGRRHSQITKAG